MKRKRYQCPNCKEQSILEYTKLFGWHSGEPNIIKAEVKCPKCKKSFWLKQKVESE